MSHAELETVNYIDGSYRRQTLRQARWVIRTVVLSMIIAVTWAAFAEINEITRGDGRVVPLRRMQVIQSLEGGILSEMLVREGDMVKEGQLIARLDATQSETSFNATLSEINALTAEVKRLESEVLEVPKVAREVGPSTNRGSQ